MTTFNALRTKGLEGAQKPITHHEQKLEESVVRARSTIFELAKCNEWQFFCTFTLNPTKYDRYNLETFRKDFTQLIRDLRKKYQTTIDYLLIPEMHKDGAWHMHGFISGLPTEWELREFTLKEKLPVYIRQKLEDGSKVYEWKKYRVKFGFCDLEQIRNAEACCKYVTKYITKDMMTSVKEVGAHTYYCSQGLKRAVELKRGRLAEQPLYNFENDYVHVAWIGEDDLDLLTWT